MSRRPTVIISALGVLHQAYHVALACQENGMLKKFFTSYYHKNNQLTALALDSLELLGLGDLKERLGGRQINGLDDELVKSRLIIEALSYAFTVVGKDTERLHYVNRLYDKMLARALPECDIFYGYEDMSFNTLLRSKEIGAISILELRSLQPLYNEMIEEEARILDVDVPSLLVSEKLPAVMRRKFAEMQVADYLLVYNNRFRRYLVEAHSIPDEKIVVVPLGAELELFYPRSVRGKQNGRFTILFVGRVVPSKGVHYLLEAVKQLDRRDFELQIIGSLSPEMLPTLARYSEHFNYIGTVPHRELVRYYGAADVFVLPSILDNFALVIYEAMSCGLPAIITENCGADIQNGLEGFIVPIRDVEALKEKILILYEDKELRQAMGRNARKWAEDHSSAKYRERVASMLLEVYHRNGART